ncbi:MAG: histidine phosphatase family protein [Clostridia bacterium]|nr:histidine phosphatase family protein [Clostridia bacterium]
MKLTLIRHGKTEGNIKGLYYGKTDLPLLPEGMEALEELKRNNVYPQAKKYYTSGMLRTEQTFFILYGDTPHEVLSGLCEIDLGDFEMRSYDQLKDDPAFQTWITGDNEANICPNGESGNAVTERALAALEPIIAAGEDAVIVTHSGVIGGVLAKLFGVGTRFDYKAEPGYGFTVEFIDGKPVSMEKVPLPIEK